MTDPTPEQIARNLLRPLQPVAKAKMYLGDCRDVLADMPTESVHLVVTDPPYFLDRMDNGWNDDKLNGSKDRAGIVGGMPVGMKFSPEQGRKLQAFMEPIAGDLLRVLMPGGFLLVFSAPRLSHRMAIAFENAGFEIRDMFAWRYRQRAQFKAFSLNHFVNRKRWTKARKAKVIKQLNGRRTPQLRPQFETIICAQKPREGTFLDNWLAYETGLIDASETLTGRVPETVMEVEKAPRWDEHLTPKPVKLCEHLIRVFSAPGQTVLDPFMGTGTTCMAARRTGRASIGIEINRAYLDVARQRLEERGI